MTTFTTQDRQDAQHTPATGALRVNVDTYRSEIYDGGKWVPIIDRNKPLTEEEIITLLNQRKFDWVATTTTTYIIDSAEIKAFARAIERAHGIGE